MLANFWITRGVAVFLFVFGGYLAIYNSMLSAIVIHQRSGLEAMASLSIAIGITGLELWFASWARNLENMRKVMKLFKRQPIETSLKLFAGGIGMALTYHYDIQTTRLSAGLVATDMYFFVWSVGWLVFGPEVTMSLGAWLWRESTDQQTLHLKKNAHKDAENAFNRERREMLISLAQQHGKNEGIRQASSRFAQGEPAKNGAGLYQD